MKKQAGFTLIEIIAVLVIGGIMMTVAGMAIVTGMKGYLFARDNASITQNAQLAMARMGRELIELTDVTSAEPSSITFSRIDGNLQTIYLDSDDDTIKIFLGANPPNGEGDILVNRVNSLSLTYNPNEGASAWDVGIKIQSLYAIKIKLELERYEGDNDIEFSTTVNPRNNQNRGGIPDD